MVRVPPVQRLRKQVVGWLQSERPRTNSSGETLAEDFDVRQRLRLLTYNIQVGISTSSYRHYLTRSWQHLLPHRGRAENLDKIGLLLRHFDVVALQEVDGGSLRSGYVNQVQYLAEVGGFPFWYQQLNRNLGRFAQHSNGLLSRFRPLSVDEHRLPGLIPGRGLIVAKYGYPEDPIVVVMMHLALGAGTQQRQLGFVRELVEGYRHVVLMGDMNTHADRILNESSLRDLNLTGLPGVSHSFPSWRPERALDHILVSRTLRVERAEVVGYPVSDHLPVAVSIELPEEYH